MSETLKSKIVRIGRKNTLVIPKRIAEKLGIGEGDRMLLIVSRG
ncbi:MAG: AbrB/MazE/SpoVT family DNA-binding domain-containing protein [Thermofilum sp.]